MCRHVLNTYQSCYIFFIYSLFKLNLKCCISSRLRKTSDSSTRTQLTSSDRHFTSVSAYDEYEVSPYEELKLTLVRNIEMSRMASIMAGTASFHALWHTNRSMSHPIQVLIISLIHTLCPPASSLSVDGQNQCLKAAQDCGLYEKCGSLRSEYVVACTKRATASDNSCNRQKCHKALRRFLERVPEEYSFALLFCPCSDTLCGERRRKTIVPSCSYEENGRGEERVGKPNCLSLQNYCSRDELCR